MEEYKKPVENIIKSENQTEKWEQSKLFQKLKDGSTKEINLVVELNGDGLKVQGSIDPDCVSVWVTDLSNKPLSSLEQRSIIATIEKGGHLDI